MSEEPTWPASERAVISSFELHFRASHLGYCELILATPAAKLYCRPQEANGRSIPSAGECVLRGAAVVERTFGGITANLWDDPFEWTLPEYLSTPGRLVEYLEEVEATRRLGFVSFAQDSDLRKEIMGPAGETRPLIDLLTEALVKTSQYGARAETALKLLIDVAVGLSRDR